MSKKTLNRDNLSELGAERLADLLIEVSTGSADIKRRLRLELAHNLGASELAKDVRKRLATLRKSSSFVGWRKKKALIKDLSTQVAMICEKIAPDDPLEAFELLWQFIELAPSIYERVDDSRGDVGDVFRTAILEFDDIAPRACLEPDALAQRVWSAVRNNGYGEWDGIISLAASALGAPGLTQLKALVEAYSEEALEIETEDHDAIRFLRSLRGGDNYAAVQKSRLVKRSLQEIAAVSGDTDAYIAQYSDKDLKRKDISAEVAMLYLAEDRDEDALRLLSAADQDGRSLGQEAWDAAYIASLIAVGRSDDAQAHRWACFSANLNPQHLRDYLKMLPDFDDLEFEEQAKEYVLQFPSFSTALHFCLNWPDVLTAANLVEARADEINGDLYSLLTPAAEALRLRHPLAAVLVLRAMIDYALLQGRSTRYGHAADHLLDCEALDAEISDYGEFPDYEQYMQSLRARHERKSSFWAKLS